MTAATNDQPTGPKLEVHEGTPADRRYRSTNPVDDFRWLLVEMGARGLSGVFLRRSLPVYVPTVGEDGYIPPIRDEDDNGPATVTPLNANRLVTRIALNYLITQSMKVGKGEHATYVDVECFFPRESAEHALNAVDAAYNLRPLRMVTHTPIVRSDGSILDVPGYDEATGVLYIPDVEVATVPATPTRAHVDAAVNLLRHMLAEFKWDGPHDEANFLGAMLTPLLRELCPPPYKLVAIMAHQPGSGKSLLNRILREVHGGVFRSEMPHDDAELEKALSSILTCTTGPVIQFDNVSGTLRSSRMAGLLTTRTYSGRVLGSTNNVDMENDRLWTVTGNNLNFGGDLVRRTLWVTLDPGCPDPHLRTGFKLDIPAFVAEHRGAILHSLLVLVAHWVANGRPMDKRSSDDYALWSGTVRGILKLAGIPGEFDHAESAQQTVGSDDEGWGDFLHALHEVWGDRTFTASDITARMEDRAPRGYDAYEKPTLTDTAQSLVDAIPGPLHEQYMKARESARAISRSLGMWLKNRDGRFAGDLVCEKAGQDKSRNVTLWRVRRHGS